MKKYVCVNIYCYNGAKKYIDTWWYDVSSQLDLFELENDVSFCKLRNIKYNLYEVER